MNRKQAFQSLEADAWFSRVFKKLKVADKALCLEFIEKNDALDRAAFELAVNRMFLDKAEKPKNWTLIVELIATANIKAFPFKREEYVRAH